MWGTISKDPVSSLSFFTVVMTSFSIIILYRFVIILTDNRFMGFLGAAFFACSAWTLNYHFMFSYTPLSTCMILTGCYFLVKSTFCLKKSRRYVFAAGLISGFSFWSSPSSVLAIPLMFLLFLGFSIKDIIKKACNFIAGFGIVFTVFAEHSIKYYAGHVGTNIGNVEHFQDALDKFSYIPAKKFFTFFFYSI